jgi:hypothetical protein
MARGGLDDGVWWDLNLLHPTPVLGEKLPITWSRQ